MQHTVRVNHAFWDKNTTKVCQVFALVKKNNKVLELFFHWILRIPTSVVLIFSIFSLWRWNSFCQKQEKELSSWADRYFLASCSRASLREVVLFGSTGDEALGSMPDLLPFTSEHTSSMPTPWSGWSTYFIFAICSWRCESDCAVDRFCGWPWPRFSAAPCALSRPLCALSLVSAGLGPDVSGEYH